MAVKLNKKILVHTTAGVAVAALLIFGISQCSEKKTIQETTNEQLENVGMALGKARKTIENFLEIKDSLSNQIDEQAKEIVLQADSIVVLNDLVKSQADSIVVLNDSIKVLNKNLNDCRNKKVQAKPVVKQKKKNVPVVKKDTKPNVVVKNDGENITKINVKDTSVNNNLINVQNQPNRFNETEINVQNGSYNNGIINVNNGGSTINEVNNYYPDTTKYITITIQKRRCVYYGKVR